MPLASKIAFQFERRLQFKGLNLFHGHAVRVTDANQSHLFGEVMGGNRYPMRITYQEGLLSVHCACAYFAETGRCKHLWAAILEADKRGVLGDAQKGGALRVVRDAEAEDLPQNPAVFGRPQCCSSRAHRRGRNTWRTSGRAWKRGSSRRARGPRTSKSST